MINPRWGFNPIIKNNKNVLHSYIISTIVTFNPGHRGENPGTMVQEGNRLVAFLTTSPGKEIKRGPIISTKAV
jgi:hypothetical protein